MVKKTKTKKARSAKKAVKKTEKPEDSEFTTVPVNLGNIIPHVLKQFSDILVRLSRLQKTVDAIGTLLAENAIKKD